MEVKPFTPADAETAKKRAMHPLMIRAVNELLGEKYEVLSGSVTLYQDEVLDRCLELFKNEIGPSAMTRSEIFDYGWLDFEDIFEEAGWRVEYDRPGYNESYKAHYNFYREM